MDQIKTVAIVGGGAAGMMAAVSAAHKGHRVCLFEHNEKLGKKIYITGKGRCNLTNACSAQDYFSNVPRNPRFLLSSVYSFDPSAAMDFFESNGLCLKVERGNRVFPVSDRASDVTKALTAALKKNRVEVRLFCDVKEIITSDGKTVGIRYTENGAETFFECEAVIMACGGMSYPSTGCSGSGYRMCEKLGHTVMPLRPALVAMKAGPSYLTDLQGLTLKNITLTICEGKEKLYTGFGELLFTHKGISGPLVLTASSLIGDKYFAAGRRLDLYIDLKPALSERKLYDRTCRDLKENANRQIKNSLSGLLPAKIIPAVIGLSGIDPMKMSNSVTREERKMLVHTIKAFPGVIRGLCGFDEATVTRGGINVKEVNPSTMESKKVSGLYICGEMLDYDALTGGYNLQAAWATGHLAGESV